MLRVGQTARTSVSYTHEPLQPLGANVNVDRVTSNDSSIAETILRYAVKSRSDLTC